MTLDLTDWQSKKYTTRDGRQVRLLCVDAFPPFSVIGLVNPGKGELLEMWDTNGNRLFTNPNGSDLTIINAKTKREGWVNIYPDNQCGGLIFKDEAGADTASHDYRVACIHIEWEE